MRKLISKLAVVAIAVMLVTNAGVALTIPAYAITSYRTWLTNSYTYLAEKQPFFSRSYGTVSGMPMFMLESIPSAIGGGALSDTVRFARTIACPFICVSADTASVTVQMFRDYNVNIPAPMVSPIYASGDSLWWDFPGEAQSFILTIASADTTAAHYYLIGGYALPAPR